MDNRPQGRKKTVGTGSGKTVGKTGSGLGTGPVGRPGGSSQNAGNYTNRPGVGGRPSQFPSGQQQYQGNEQRDVSRGLGGKGLLIIVALIAVLVLGGGGISGLFGNLFGGGTTGTSVGSAASSASSSSSGLSSLLSGFLGNGSFTDSTVSGDWSLTPNTGDSVRSSTAAKRTTIYGGGKDTVTIMVYMCGTDLESKSGMATNDLNEMRKATIGRNVNLIVFTGGCKQWKNNYVSNSVNQIYQITGGSAQPVCLESNYGKAGMTNPDTLSEFIRYCAKNYPANRNMLIFWDHGGGSLSGYGYDEKNANSGSMTLSGIQKALSAAKVQFDIIGFDACLMATLETGLTLEPYADYMIASEETEPGIGWYYTNWLTELSSNTSMPSVQIGKRIIDDFTKACAQSCRGQKTTLSIVDLAELSANVPEQLKSFAVSISSLIQSNNYQQVSDARSSSREFASSSKIDQIDLVSFATNLGTDEGKALSNALLGAVKYNKTSSNVSNAYGISIYFPYQKTGKVSSAVSTYNAIGMDSEYARCIQQFAAQEQGGQVSGSGSSSIFGSLLGGSGGLDVGSLLGGDGGLDVSSLLGSLLGGREMPVAGQASDLVWQKVDGTWVLKLSEEQWSMVNRLELNVLADDGEGYFDLGTDNVYDTTDDGDLIGAYDGTWVAVDDQPVAYYYEQTQLVDDEALTFGYVPVLWNGDRAELLICFDGEGIGSITGVRLVYLDGETETVAKAAESLQEGDVIDFVADYYSYDGVYDDSYVIATWAYHDGYVIENVPLAQGYSAVYLLTDLYNNLYWTEEIP